MSGRALGDLAGRQRAVRERVALGQSLEQVDAELIAGADADEDARAALWLYAWHEISEREEHREPRFPRTPVAS